MPINHLVLSPSPGSMANHEGVQDHESTRSHRFLAEPRPCCFEFQSKSQRMRQHRLPSLLPPLLSPGLCSKEEEKEEDEDEDETTLMLATTTRRRSRTWFRAGVNGMGGSADCGREHGVDPRRSVLMGLNTESMSPPGEEGHASIPAQLTRLDHFAYLARVWSATNLHFPLGITTDYFFPSCGGGHLSVKKSCRTFA